MLGSAITFWLIDTLFGSQREHEAAEQAIRAKKEQLVRQMASTVPDEAIRAVEELRSAGWMFDGTLEGKYFDGANLQGANLSRARLNRASFKDANLEGANLNSADMKESDLTHANLREAEFRKTDLSYASLFRAQAQRAKFEDANLRHADLWVVEADKAYFADANLQEANLRGASLNGACLARANLRDVDGNVYAFHCDENTILPDETKWQTNDDLKKFIDPVHPDFFEVRTPYWQESEVDKADDG